MWGIRLKLSQPCRAVHVRWQIAIGNATPYHIAIGNVMWCVSTWMCTYCTHSCVCTHAACGSACYCLLAREQVFDCIVGNRFLIALYGSWCKCRTRTERRSQSLDAQENLLCHSKTLKVLQPNASKGKFFRAQPDDESVMGRIHRQTARGELTNRQQKVVSTIPT